MPLPRNVKVVCGDLFVPVEDPHNSYWCALKPNHGGRVHMDTLREHVWPILHDTPGWIELEISDGENPNS